MKKIFTLIAGIAFASGAFATTPYKCLHAEATVSPTGGGVVYLAAKNDDEAGFVVDNSEDYGETSFIKFVGGENSNGQSMQEGVGAGIGFYEIKVFAEAEAGYELVCYANKIKEDGVYTKEDCYTVIHGDSEQDFSFDFEYTGEGDKINVNNIDHPEDGNSSDGPSREDLYNNFDAYSTGVDTYIYVIFRKVGDELPKFDPEGEGGGEDGISNLNATVESNDAMFNLSGQAVNASYKGLVIKGGKKYIVK